MAVGKGARADLFGQALAVERAFELSPDILAGPARARSQAVGDRKGIGVTRETGVVGQGGQLPENIDGVGVGGDVDAKGETGVGVEPGHGDEQARADLEAAHSHRRPPAGAAPQEAGRFQFELADQRSAAPGQRAVLGHADQRHLAGRRPVQQFLQPLGGDAPVGLQVPVDQDDPTRTGFIDAAGNEAPLGPVPQEVDVNGRFEGDGCSRRGQAPATLGAAAVAPQEVHLELLLLLQGALAALPAGAGGPGSGYLEATGVGYQRLAAVHGEAVRRGREPGQSRQLNGGKKIEVAPARVGKLGGTATQELGQALRRFGNRGHARMLEGWPRGCFSGPTGHNGPMPRAIWSGSISFGLVNVPVKLVTATSPKDIRFHQLHASDGGRINQKRVCSLDGEEVDYSEIVKGYELRRGQYVVVEPDDLEGLAPEATRSIDIEEFVDLVEIDPLYFEHSYYLVPDGPAARPYALLVEAMAGTGKVGIGRFVLRTKQYLAALRPRDGALVLSTMLFADEVVQASELEVVTTKDTKPSERELTMARQLVSSLSGEWEPAKYKDDYRDKVIELIEAKAEGNEIAVPEAPERAAPVLDLMAALEASLARAEDGHRSSQNGSQGRARKRASA